jgi:hypothetical protein
VEGCEAKSPDHPGGDASSKAAPLAVEGLAGLIAKQCCYKKVRCGVVPR